MAQFVGSTISDRYRIEKELGAGGMATVYLGLDLKHNRKVAVKVLRPELSAIVGAERFLNEIRTTANLQHPHILPLHDSGEINGVIFYVMPLVEGESLRDRLNREKQLPIDDSVRIAHDAADALDYAHRHGVIHRDIKPENILLHDGRAVVADFGIALAVSTAGGATRMTETGMSLGTPHYMSPEQAMGEREVTARSDVYALGCVLYEMLSGEPPFTGPTAQAIIAKVVTSDPADLTTLRRTVPPHVASAVHWALQRLPADRFGSAREFADAVSGKEPARVTYATSARHRVIVTSPWKALLPWGLLAASVVAAALGWSRSGPEPPKPQVMRFEVVPDERLLSGATGTNIAISLDGSQLIYRRRGPTGAPRHALRNLATMEEREFSFPLANNPRFSPDGRWVLFQVQGGIRKARLSGGSPIVVVDSGLRAVWGESRIVYEWNFVLWSIPETGGQAERLTTLDSTRQETRHTWADFLPGWRHLVFAIEDTTNQNDELAVLSLDNREVKRLGVLGTSPHYVDGHLVFGRYDGTAWAVPFDLDRLEVSGQELQIIDRLIVRGGGAVEMAVAGNGTVAYIEGTAEDLLAEVDDEGRSRPVVDERNRYIRPKMSPDGAKVAVVIRDAGASANDLWLLDVASKGARRITTDKLACCPNWGPEGRSVIWWEADSLGTRVLSQVLDGRSGITTLFSAIRGDSGGVSTIDVDPSGRWVTATRGRRGTDVDILIAPLDSPLIFRPLIATQAVEQTPSISHDGRRLAYASNERGIGEVYVTTFPEPSEKTRISTGGGLDPVWSKDGQTLYYRGSGRMIAARFKAPPGGFTTDSLFQLDQYPRAPTSPRTSSFSITPGGKLLLAQADQSRRLVMVLSFGEELRQRFAELQRSR